MKREIHIVDEAQLNIQESLAKVGPTVPGFIGTFKLTPEGSMSLPSSTPGIEELCGIPASVLATDMSGWVANVHPDDVEPMLASVFESKRTGGKWHHAFRYRHPTNGLRWIEGWGAPEPETQPDGSTLWHGVVMDVTDRRLAEQRVSRLSDLYRTLTEVNQAIVRAKSEAELCQRVCDVLSGLGGLVLVRIAAHEPKRNVLINKGFTGQLRVLDIVRELPVDASIPEGRSPIIDAFRRGAAIIVNDMRSVLQDSPWNEAVLGAGGASGVALPLRRGGQVFGVLGMAAREVGYFDVEVVRLLEGTVENISFGLDSLASAAALHEKEEQLHFAQRMEAVGRLAGGVAHDFNNLLMVISSYTDLAMDAVRPEDPLHADLDEIRKAAVRATALTKQLVAFGRKQVLKPLILDLNELIEGMGSMLRRLLTAAIDLTFAPDDLLGHTRSDPGQIENVLMNLAVNARDAMPTGGTLTIRTSNIDIGPGEVDHYGCTKPGPYVKIAVSDTGCGMDEATLARAFEPFFTTKPTGKGTGLGLATVYGIVAQSGGGVRAESRVGEGSTFEVLLPREESEETEPSGPSPAPAVPRGAGTLLVVEDEEPVRKVACRILAGAGYTVLSAASGAEALSICESHASEIKLMLSDVVMPGMNGSDLAARVARSRPSMKVLYMSGYTGDAIMRDGILPPGTQLISKPFSAEALLSKIRELLRAV